NAVQIRRLDSAPDQWRQAESAGNNSMWVRGTLPADLDLVGLRNQTGGFDMHWEAPPFANVQRESSPRGFAELAISGDDLRRIWSQGVLAERDIKVEVQDLRIDGYLQGWILDSKQKIAGRGTDAYQPPRLDELIYFDQEILSPLLAAIRRDYRDGDWAPKGLNALRVIDAAASAFGYEIIRYKHRRSDQEYIILAERDDTQSRRFWGTYVFRLDQRNDYIVQIPRPGFEQNSFEFGAALFERINAGALLIAGAHPDSNRDRSADVIQIRNMQSVFTLVHQVLLRDLGVTPTMTIQSRALGAQKALAVPDADALMALSDGTYRREHAGALTQALLEQLDADQLAVRLVDGSPQTAGYEVGFLPQLRYLEASENKVFASLWVSPLARASYRQQTENRVFGSQFDVLDIPTIDADLQTYVTTTLTPSAQEHLNTQLSADLDRYVATHDLVTLQRIVLSWPDYHWLRVNDIDSQQVFVLVLDADRALLAAVNLRPRHPQQVVATGGVPIEIETVERFIATRAGKLVVTQR
ncbi:MAG: hypothetical protein OEQ39_25045, partial [Gammaproteobacteria bacterium]|nr:hypothetical protein [Gammaproteobacteria bacterium]